MSAKHPMIAITGSSGAGTSTVKTAFEHMFFREDRITSYNVCYTKLLRHDIVGVHVKETLPVGPNSPGAFRDIPFGQGTVDFVHCFKTLRDLNYT